MWKYNASTVDLEWSVSIEYTEQATIGTIDLGLNGDIGLDTGNRENENTIIDQGLRVI